MNDHRKILVPIEFSEQSLVALNQTYNLARYSNSSITLLYVNYKGGDSKDKIEEIKTNLEKKVAEIKNEHQIEAEFIIAEGKVYDQIINVAEKNKIPFQRMASSRVTGTDTDAFAYSVGGVASALISLPLRYMHTTVESVHKEDVENVIRLIFETLKTLKSNQDFNYLR